MSEKPLFVKVDTYKAQIDLETGKMVGSEWFDGAESFREHMAEKAQSGVSWNELHREITDWHYRRPIPIPLTHLAIRPFWRDGRDAPPLSWDDQELYKRVLLDNKTMSAFRGLARILTIEAKK